MNNEIKQWQIVQKEWRSCIYVWPLREACSFEPFPDPEVTFALTVLRGYPSTVVDPRPVRLARWQLQRLRRKMAGAQPTGIVRGTDGDEVCPWDPRHVV